MQKFCAFLLSLVVVCIIIIFINGIPEEGVYVSELKKAEISEIDSIKNAHQKVFDEIDRRLAVQDSLDWSEDTIFFKKDGWDCFQVTCKKCDFRFTAKKGQVVAEWSQTEGVISLSMGNIRALYSNGKISTLKKETSGSGYWVRIASADENEPYIDKSVGWWTRYTHQYKPNAPRGNRLFDVYGHNQESIKGFEVEEYYNSFLIAHSELSDFSFYR